MRLKKYVNFDKTVEISTLNTARSVIKWRGKYDILQSNSELGRVDIPSSGAGLRSEEKSDDQYF